MTNLTKAEQVLADPGTDHNIEIDPYSTALKAQRNEAQDQHAMAVGLAESRGDNLRILRKALQERDTAIAEQNRATEEALEAKDAEIAELRNQVAALLESYEVPEESESQTEG